MAIPALFTTQNLGLPRTEVNTKEYASVMPRNQIREALQSALRGFKEIPRKCSTHSIWIHFFKALVTMKSTHTSLPLLCAGIITKQLWKLQSHTPFTQVKGHNFVSFWGNEIDQTESYTWLPELPRCSLGILILCSQVSSHRRTEALCSWILFKVILQLYT